MSHELIKIDNKIYYLRGLNVMLDSDLAALYGVETKKLNQAVKRNRKRFPEDFMFQLTKFEWENLRSQIGTANYDGGAFLKSQFVTSKPSPENRGGKQKLPYVFTEMGVSMLSSVLNSERAISINIAIMRTFVKMRHLALTRKNEIDYTHLKKALLLYMEKNDERVNDIIAILDQMRDQPEPPRKKIGFVYEDK